MLIPEHVIATALLRQLRLSRPFQAFTVEHRGASLVITPIQNANTLEFAFCEVSFRGRCYEIASGKRKRNRTVYIPYYVPPGGLGYRDKDVTDLVDLIARAEGWIE